MPRGWGPDLPRQGRREGNVGPYSAPAQKSSQPHWSELWAGDAYEDISPEIRNNLDKHIKHPTRVKVTSATQLTFGSVYIICSLLFALNTFLQKCLCHQVCAHGFVCVCVWMCACVSSQTMHWTGLLGNFLLLSWSFYILNLSSPLFEICTSL